MQAMHRDYPRYSLCGLNCGLCPMHHPEGEGCPGCGGAGQNRNCDIMRCAADHGGVPYCFQCPDYPCARYADPQAFTHDSFVLYRNTLTDFARAKAMGIDAYRAELDEKVAILSHLLAHYNDGRRKSPFCTAVNALDLDSVRDVMARLAAEDDPALPVKERGAIAMRLFEQKAAEQGISIKLNRKKQDKKT